MYMNAKHEKRRTELYAMDLLWMLARTKYDVQSPCPSHVEMHIEPADRRSYTEILADLKKKTQELQNGSV